jgi:hypothetical protein
VITADVTPFEDKSTETAKTLQLSGFRIVSIGESITVAGGLSLFEKFFSVKMIKKSKITLPGLDQPATAEYFTPENAPVIPAEFKFLIRDITFPEPPEFFST